jgi:hypothetical protein
MKIKIDKRKKTYKTLSIWFNKYTLAALMWGLIIGSLFGCYLASRPKQALSSPLGQKIEFKVEKVIAQDTRCDYDPITYIRCSGEKLGKSNQEIMTMIRIARAESNFRPRAKNPNSTASGIFQIIYGTWNSNNCQGNAFNFVDNINCAWEIQSHRGFQPWVSSSKVWNK